jgi:hypothetical protein
LSAKGILTTGEQDAAIRPECAVTKGKSPDRGVVIGDTSMFSMWEVFSRLSGGW